MAFEFTQPTQRTDWDRSGWNRFLPFEGEVLWHVFCDATVWGVDGDIDVLLDWQESMHPMLSPDAPGCREPRPAPRRRRPHRRAITRMLADSGEEYPRTLDEVAELGVSLGLYRRSLTEDTVRWRAPAALPLPTEVLPMTPRQRRAEDEYRWLLGGADTARGIAELLLDGGEASESVTSIAFLAQSLGCDPASVRRGLEFLCAGPGGRAFMRVYMCDGPRRRRAVDPQRLRADDPCVVAPQWRRLWKRFGLMWHLEGRGEFLLLATGLAESDKWTLDDIKSVAAAVPYPQIEFCR
ncbi:MAG: DUF6042 family protein, partial [Stackebrandtia sp.]